MPQYARLTEHSHLAVGDVTVEHAEAASQLRAATARLGRLLGRQTVNNLSLAQWSALVSVETHGTVRIGDLGDLEHVSPSTATRLVASLEELGLIMRTGRATDRRSAYVSLTPAGVDILAEGRRSRTAQLAQRLAMLTPNELQRIVDALPVLDRLAREE